jgi:hypothetical protein
MRDPMVRPRAESLANDACRVAHLGPPPNPGACRGWWGGHVQALEMTWHVPGGFQVLRNAHRRPVADGRWRSAVELVRARCHVHVGVARGPQYVVRDWSKSHVTALALFSEGTPTTLNAPARRDASTHLRPTSGWVLGRRTKCLQIFGERK